MTEYRISVPKDQSVTVYLTDGTAVKFNCDYEYSQNHSISLTEGVRICEIRIEDSADCYLELTEDNPYYKKYVEQSDVEEITTSKLEKAHNLHESSVEAYSKQVGKDAGERPIGQISVLRQFANVDDEPENIDKDFLKAQLSVKNQSILRNVLAIVSSVAVAIMFLLEKLGII